MSNSDHHRKTKMDRIKNVIKNFIFLGSVKVILEF